MSNVTEYVSGSPGTTELRKTSNSTANAFVTVTYSYEMESKGFAQLFSYPCNGLNPAAGFWRFFFIDSRNWSGTCSTNDAVRESYGFTSSCTEQKCWREAICA